MTTETTTGITGGDTRGGAKRPERRWLFAAAALLLALVAAGYAAAFAMPPLLDEQFLLAWLAEARSGGLSEASRLLAWQGPDPACAWHPVTPLSFLLVPLSHALPHRLVGVVVHWLASLELFLVARRLLPGRTPAVAMSAAALFALYPLHPEAVSWMGGRAAELSFAFFLAAFLCYLRARPSALPPVAIPVADREVEAEAGSESRWNRRWLAAGLGLYLLCLSSWGPSWTGVLILAAFEQCFTVGAGRSARGILSTFAGLAWFAMIAAVFLGGSIALGAAAGLWLDSPSTGSALSVVKNMLLPVNQQIWQGYSRQYRLLYMLLAPLAVLLPLACWKDIPARRAIVFSALWLVAAALPVSAVATQGTDLYGSSLLYWASAPLCLLFALGYFGLSSITSNFRWATNAAALVMVGLLSILFFRHLWNQNSAYRVSGRVLAAIQGSMKVVVDKERVPFVVATDIPGFVAVARSFSVAGAPLFDGSKRLLSARSVPPGNLKEALRAGRLREAVLRWDRNFQSLVRLDLSPDSTNWGPSLAGQKLVDQLRPALHHMVGAGISYDADEQALFLERNSAQGPALSLRGEGLSPLDGDFFYVDARIDTPGQPLHPQVELHWLTVLDPDYDRSRSVATTVLVNDGSYHRYYLPLRTIGWTTNGPQVQLTIGFPPGAKVWLREVGVEGGDDRIPRFQLSDTAPATGPLFYAFLYNYPQRPELGLSRINRRAEPVAVRYSVTNIAGATGALVEVSRPGRTFANPNGSELSTETLKTYAVNSVEGRWLVPAGELSEDGVYSLRLIATDSRGKMLGNFSNEIDVLVTGTP